MKLSSCCLLLALSLSPLTSFAQTPTSTFALPSASTDVPKLVKFSGKATDETGKPITGLVGVTFSLYKDQQGGAALWIETQNVQTDANGHYTALLGASTSTGIPLEIFSSAEAHWVGTQVSGHREQPRVLLLSVPYALKAADAETLGGLPASAFMHASTGGAQGKTGAAPASPTEPNLPPAGVTGKGTKNFVPVWTGATALGNSLIYQTGSNLGIGTKTPQAEVDIVGTGARGIQATVPGTQAAISGIATATKGGTTGVYGQSSDPGGNAVFGMDNATTGGIGVIGQSTATSGSATGVFGQSASTNGTGVVGIAAAKSGAVYGVGGYASSTGQFSAGLNGLESAKTGQVYGVIGQANSTTTNSAGVNGIENATTGVVWGVVGGTNSTTAGAAGVNGFEGAATGAVYGVAGSTNSTTNFAAGISGYEGATTGQVYGVSGSTNSTTNGAAGVIGSDNATSGQVFGVFGYTNSATNFATGVVGNANATTGQVTGLAGNSASTSGTGVFGNATATTGATQGVFGQTASPTGHGTSGYASATSGPAIGVVGLTNSPGGAGGQFVNLGGGTSLVLIGAGANYAQVFTVDASGNGFFAGNLNVKGKLTKGSGSFKIDHPGDPANKYLSHSFVESPDMMNVYNGVVVLDAHGSAWVTLPDYFEALNRDFRYQLTAVGVPGPNLYIAKKVSGDRFKIAGGKPHGEVSWQVTGIRQDAYANAYRIPVEEDKPTAEQGYYLHPEVFGQPASKSIQAASQKVSATDQLARVSNP
jgi:hypothetical protein